MALGEETWRRNTSWADTFNELKSLHDQAYKKIDEALKYDEEGQKDKALVSYDQGLMLLDKALAVNIECPTSPDLSWERACCMVDKMRKTRKEILSRVADTQVRQTTGSLGQQTTGSLGQQTTGPLQHQTTGPWVGDTQAQQMTAERPEDLQLEPPPSYEEAMATTPASDIPPPSPRTYGELGEVLQSLKVETNMQSVKVIFLVEGVRMYFISPDGSVSAPSQPTQLRVLELDDGREQGLPKFFLQVGEWFYPLVPDVSPCFRSDYGAFILPDVQAQVEGAAVGLILPPEADISLLELLEDVLHGVVSRPPAAPPRRTRRENLSNTISKGIVTGAQFVSTGLMRGAEAASNYVSSTTPRIISKLSPEEQPRPVPPTLRTGAKVARSVTHTAVNVTGFVAGKVGSATMALGRYLAPHVQRGGTKLLAKVGVAEDKAAEGVGGVLTVAAGAVEGFGTIYTGLEQSANMLGSSLANNTVRIVQHKYGEPMAEVTGNTLYTMGNVYNTTNNISNLTPKGLAKRTAKDTGKALVETHKPDLNGTIKPDLNDTDKPSTSKEK